MVVMNSKLALALLAFCSSVLSTPVIEKNPTPITVPLTHRTKSGLVATDIVLADKSRRTLIASPKKRSSVGNTPATNTAIWYTIPVEVGEQTFNLLVDTGSSNTWVGSGNTTYVAGRSAANTNSTFLVFYGSGIVFGTLFNDTVTIAGLQAASVPVGNATLWSGFSEVDGIAAFGPQDLTIGSDFTFPNGIPTLMQSLVSQGKISNNVVGIYFKPESGSDTHDVNGEVTIGGVDNSKLKGRITYAPITTADFYSTNWAINVTSISFGSNVIKSDSHAALVDTGTTFTYIPEDAFDAFMSATGGATDPATGLVYFTTPPTETFSFEIGGTHFPLTPSQYLMPASQTANFGVNNTFTWSWILDGGIDVDLAGIVNFIIGQKFLENYYSVFDTDNSRIGFAPVA